MPKISKGLATWAGLVAAVGQYMGSFALFMEADDKALALGPLATATATLWKVIEGRMNQATALAAKTTTVQSIAQSAAAHGIKTSGSTGTSTHYFSTGAEPIGIVNHPAGKRALGEPTDLSLEIPGGGIPQDGERP